MRRFGRTGDPRLRDERRRALVGSMLAELRGTDDAPPPSGDPGSRLLDAARDQLQRRDVASA